MTTRKLDDILQSGSDLAALATRARQMQSLCDAVRGALPAPLAAAIIATSCHEEDRTLVVIAASPAFAARLRFHSDDLLSAARAHGVHAARCRVRVSPQANTGDG